MTTSEDRARRVLRIVLRLAPAGWRSTIFGDVTEEAQADGHGTLWLISHLFIASIRLRLAVTTDTACVDARQAVRSLLRTPAFAFVAIATLAVGIGVNTAFFSVVYGVIFRPLPYHDAERLVLVEAYRDTLGRRTRTNYSLADLEDWRGATTFASLALVSNASYTLATDAGAEIVSAAVVTGDFFRTLGGRLLLGRTLDQADDDQPVVVISERRWRQLGAPDDIVGSLLTLNNQRYSVSGVMDTSFRYPRPETDLWIPAGFAQRSRVGPLRRGSFGFNPVARLAPEASPRQAQIEVDRVSRALAGLAPAQYGQVSAVVVDLHERVAGGNRAVLTVLWMSCVLVLLAACLNLAHLQWARAAVRDRETALRLALGASHGRLFMQSVTETAVLTVLGSGLALALANWTIKTVVAWPPPGLTRLDAIHLDWPVLLFATTLAMGTTLIAGAPTALIRQRGRAVTRDKGWDAPSGRRDRRFRQALVIAQVSVSLVLLVGAATLGRSLVTLLRTDIGVPQDGVLTMLLELAPNRTLSDADADSLVSRVLERVGRMPTVEQAAVAAALPPNRPRFRIEVPWSDPSTGQSSNHLVDAVPATPGFFAALRLPLIRGRRFVASDTATAPPVIILSEDLARTFFGDADPVGKSLPVEGDTTGQGTAATIVGVVGRVKYSGLEAPAAGAIYRPWAQQPLPSAFLVIQTAGDPQSLAATARREVAIVDPQIAVTTSDTLEALVAFDIAEPRFRTLLLIVMAAMATSLAAIGLWGIVAYSVVQRTRELGVRLALGAMPSALVVFVMREGLLLVFVGVGLGAIVAMAASRLLVAHVPNLASADLTTFGCALLVLLLVSAGAIWWPSRRAALADPLRALRSE